MKIKEIMSVFLPVGILFILLFFVIVALGYGSLEFCGFGIDNNDLLYVGRLHQIEIYEEGKQIEKIDTPIDRGWVMTVDENSNIVVSNMSKIFLLDATGEILTTQTDIHGKAYYTIRDIRQIQSLDGAVYQLKFKWIWPTIFKNGSVIYRTPFVDVIMRILFFVGSAFLLIGIIACKKDNQNRD